MQSYTFKKKTIQENKFDSIEQLEKIEQTSDWLWIDFEDPSKKDYKLLSKILEEDPNVLDCIKNLKPLQECKRHQNYHMISASIVSSLENFQVHQIFIILKENQLLTVRTKLSSRLFENLVQKLKDKKTLSKLSNPANIVTEILVETANQNLEILLNLRENIEKIEEEVVLRPSNKKIINEVFILKRELNKFYRLLSHHERVLDKLKDGRISAISPNKKDILILEEIKERISQELVFLQSYDNSLDGILRLQDLGMIHKVESRLINLTWVIVILEIILLLLEFGVIDLLIGS